MYKLKTIENKIHNSDCTEFMKCIPSESIDLIVTDPPYNIGQENKRTKVGNEIISNKEAWGEWDDFDNKEFDAFMFKVMSEMYRVLKKGGILYCFTARKKNGFYCDYACNETGFTYQNTIAIIKNNPLPHFTKTNWRSAFELAFYVSKGKPKTFNFLSQREIINTIPYNIGKKIGKHPTEKPEKAISLLIRASSNISDIVLDPFNGGGTTTSVAKKLKRKFIGIDKSKEYCDMAEKRLINTQRELFD